MFRFLCAAFITLSFPILMMAQQKGVDSIGVILFFQDSYSHKGIDGVKVSFLLPDSTILFTDTASHSIAYDDAGAFPTGGGVLWGRLPAAGNYLLHITADNYEETYFHLDIPERHERKRVTLWTQEIPLRKRPKRREITLDGAKVKATRIKMVMKNDTVVFNADAFQLAEGDLLEQLIEQLPGMKLDDGGVITFNGQKVEDLLVNGREFFKGDPKIALENLPAYVVKNIKVYRRAGDAAYLMKDSLSIEKSKRLVADVILKKQYNQGWLSNIEGGLGSYDKYKAKLFVMRYTDQSKLFVFGSTNNVSDMQKPGSDGSWQSGFEPAGVVTSRMGGITFNLTDRKTRNELNTSLQIERTSTDEQQKMSGVNYLTGGDIYNRNRTENKAERTQYKWTGMFTSKMKKMFFSTSSSWNHERRASHNLSLGASLQKEPYEKYRGALLDSIFKPGLSIPDSVILSEMRQSSSGLIKSHTGSVSASLMGQDPLFGNSLSVSLSGNYSNTENEQYSHYNLLQPKAGEKNFQNQYAIAPDRRHSFAASLNYHIEAIPDILKFDLSYNYSNSYSKGERDLFQLSRISGWDEPSAHVMGQLPSTHDSLMMAFDRNNSFYTVNRSQSHQISFPATLAFGKDKGDLTLRAPIEFYSRRLVDVRSKKNRLSDRGVLVSPSISFDRIIWHTDKISNLSLSYSFSRPLTDLSQSLDVTDDSDPLFIQRGNKNLKRSKTHSVDFSMGKVLMERNFMRSGGIRWSVTKDAVAMARFYDRSTGVTITSPHNIDGNWDTSVYFVWKKALDKKKFLSFEFQTTGTYSNSADFLSESREGIMDSYRSSVRSASISQDVILDFSKKKMNFSVNGHLDWRNFNSHRQNFNTTNSFDMIYAFTAKTPLWGGIDLSSDIALHMRRGYNDANMNDTKAVWNATLTRAFFKAKQLICMVDCFDILGQLDNVRSYLNGQGRSETWYNSIPRYIMLRLCYRFNILPKKN